jgi:hypothetical protein
MFTYIHHNETNIQYTFILPFVAKSMKIRYFGKKRMKKTAKK